MLLGGIVHRGRVTVKITTRIKSFIMSSKVVCGSKGNKHGVGECTHLALKSNILYPKYYFVSEFVSVALSSIP